MDGFSKRQLLRHEAIYQELVAQLNAVHDRLAAGGSLANGDYSEVRALKMALSYALNGVKLHEAYFENLGGAGGQPLEMLRTAVERDFGSFDCWASDFRTSGLCARGWVVLALDLDDRRLHNFIVDGHDSQGIWHAVPIVVLDVCEHAYFLDYAGRCSDYIGAFFRNVDLPIANHRLSAIGKLLR